MELAIAILNRNGGTTDIPVPTVRGIQDFCPGHVLEARPDGWKWGREELTNPKWRIVKVPDLLFSDLEALQQLPAASANSSLQPTKFRNFKINLSALPLAVTTALSPTGAVVDLTAIFPTALQFKNFIVSTWQLL